MRGGDQRKLLREKRDSLRETMWGEKGRDMVKYREKMTD